jgi:hypothetical protein
MKKYIFIILVIVLAAALIVSFKTSAQSTTLTGGVSNGAVITK